MNIELIAYYANLLILQYRTKPKAVPTIMALIRAIMFFNIIREVENGYDIETAIGKQLDVIAKYVGAERLVNSLDLTDSELRILTKLKIAQNNSNHSNAEIDNILHKFFPGQIIFTDNQNMTISYIFSSDIEWIINVALAQGAIPKPAAVSITTNFVQDIENIFSLKKYASTAIPDFSEGLITYSDDPFGSFLTY